MAGYLPLLVDDRPGDAAFAGAVVPRLEAARAEPAERGQGGAVRVGDRARPGSRPQRFPVRFYLVAMIFIIFDIEIIFTYPWAVIYTPRPRDLRAGRDGGVRRRRVRVVPVPDLQRRPRLGPGQRAGHRPTCDAGDPQSATTSLDGAPGAEPADWPQATPLTTAGSVPAA